MIAENNNRLYRAYQMKEMLRLLLKIKDTDEAEAALNRWLWWASHSRIGAFKELYLKIKRHREHILNAIRLGVFVLTMLGLFLAAIIAGNMIFQWKLKENVALFLVFGLTIPG